LRFEAESDTNARFLQQSSQAYLPKVENIRVLKEARIEVITENNKTPTADAVNCNTTHPNGKLKNSVYLEENAFFRGEKIHDSID
jgi:hypothetical protein